MSENATAVRAASIAGAGAPITVLHSLAPPDGTTKYVDQVTSGAPAEVQVRHFSWSAALRDRYDVLHLHWPELLLRARTPALRFGKRQAMRMLLRRAARTGTPIVRTLHNVATHESGTAAERRLLSAIDRRTDLFVRLNPSTPAPPDARPDAVAVDIPHGHYRDRFAAHPRSRTVPGRLLYFGIIRPYKGVERLLEVYDELRPAGTELRLVGNPSPELRARVEAAVAASDRVSARLAFVDDDELVREVTAAQLVVLPYAEMHNSGVLLVALSLGRRVLVPRSPANEAIAAEVGPGWIIQYDGAFDAAALELGLAALRAAGPADSPGEPDLAGRDWDEIGRRHAAAYRALLERKRAG
ncbi:glycosyltransferase [Agromyces intestinalis]|uniref:Glycosyltransferase n=1 Tax=Agromyces intestinalis TaxID=2592652 RepID=A0A5C1YF61_9MICO|nr:glycosyltransferase [Agromyces intestinalis]QEO14165.1 glycosyltransferase [Agromyces intestinalis]